MLVIQGETSSRRRAQCQKCMLLTTNQTDEETESIDADEWCGSAACSFRKGSKGRLRWRLPHRFMFFLLPFTPDFIDSAAPGLAPKLAKGRWSEMDKGKRGEFPPLRPVAWDANTFFFSVFRGNDLTPCI